MRRFAVAKHIRHLAAFFAFLAAILCHSTQAGAAVALSQKSAPTLILLPDAANSKEQVSEGSPVRLGDMVFKRGPTPNSVVTGLQWPGGLVYFGFASNVTSAHQQIFLDAVAHWSAASSVQFVQDTSVPNHILVVEENVTGECGNSYVGMEGGEQDVFINSYSGYACWTNEVVQHEVGHALGLGHEQQRADRDTYITITEFSGTGSCFDNNNGIEGSAYLTAYDYNSIMQYTHGTIDLDCGASGSTSFTIDATNVGQPPGLPAGSEAICNDQASCNTVMGKGLYGNFSLRDGYGMANLYGYRLKKLPVSGNGTGTVSLVFGDYMDSCGTDCYELRLGSTVTVTATSSPDSIAYISGVCSGHTSCSNPMNSNQTVEVRFLLRSTVAAVVSVLTRADQIFADGFGD